MACRVGINGFGRVGRMVMRRSLETPQVEIAAVNDLADIGELAYLLKYDSVHGVLPAGVEREGEALRVGGRKVRCFGQADPGEIPWGDLGIDIVIEATGAFRRRQDSARHLKAGARKVIISAPSDDADATVVLGVNEDQYDPARHDVVSMASCTTNSLAPVAKVLQDSFGISRLFFTTIHAYTSSQSIMDKPTRHRRRGRAGALCLIPTTTGAAQATARVLPGLEGKMDGMAIRVPLPDGSITDIVADLLKPTTPEEINSRLLEASRTPRLKGILAVNDEEIVSADIVGNSHSSIVDAPSTGVLDRTMAKILAWYDNEWGYSCRLVDLAARMAP